MSIRLLLGRIPGDNALLTACPRDRRHFRRCVRAVVAMLTYGVAAGTFLWLVVALRAGGGA
ncbi:hypothetical protein [Paraburkholderia antibiotica]|uniref:Uncharacterized protein n=1 Tax=Paraburkholderia antibiotica TaxID=2728839 RepID=A0A7Y0A108_9BURK|nr:hypothetical protein [Paraburkholderia antibiotica]NML34545.1 hypothetical protein [Paraburkholderia antibiotica]